MFKYMYPNIAHFFLYVITYILGVTYGFSLLIFIFFHYAESSYIFLTSQVWGKLSLHLRLGSAVKIRTQRHILIICPFRPGIANLLLRTASGLAGMQSSTRWSPDGQPGVALNWVYRGVQSQLQKNVR